MTKPFWSSDIDSEQTGAAKWQPVLQTGPLCLPLPVWFMTEDDCDKFITNEVIPALLKR